MTREEKCKLAIQKGFTYDPISGKIYGIRGKEVIKKCGGYIKLNMSFNGKLYLLSGHQFAYYYIYKKVVDYIDHINGIKDDNRICNLRETTNQKNQWNQHKCKGYYLNKGKYIARIVYNKKLIYLGCFDTEERAKLAYLEAKEKYHII